MSIFDLFKKEEPKKSDRETVSEVRSTTQQIAGILGRIRFAETADITGRIPQEKMDWYRKTITGLTNQIDRAQVLRLDTSAIDQSILFLAEELPDAIRYGNMETADRIIKGLTYGITRGRKDIGEKDMDKSSQIVEARLNRLQIYRNIVKLSTKIDELTKTMAQQEKSLERYQSDYDQCREDLRKISVRRPDLVRELDELGFGSNQLSAGAKGIDTARLKVIELSDSIENLERQKATNEAAMQENVSTIRTLEIQMTQADALLDEQTLSEIRAQQERFLSETLKLERQIDEMESINKNFTHAMDAIYSSPEMVDRIIRHAMEYEELERKEAAKEAGIREGLENEAQENEANDNGMMLNF